MSTPDHQDEQPLDGPAGALLRRREQQVIVVLALVGLCALAVRWGRSGPLVEAGREAAPVEFRLDVNTATWPELAQLPGIGDVKARAIVESRETAGPFASHEDLERVSGIGKKIVAKIKPYLLPIGPKGERAK